MSQWTHVNASIRFDGILGMGLPTEKELGKICKYGDKDYSHWDKPDLPLGSEGSIEYEIVKTGGENSLACMVVVFAGDLRDYNNSGEILDYFIRITKKRMIRSGILEITVEGEDTLIYRFNEERWLLLAKITV